MFSTCPAVSNVCKFGMQLPTLGSQLGSFPNLCRSNASILLLGIFNLGVPWSAVRHFAVERHLGSKRVLTGSTANSRTNWGNEETDTVETEVKKHRSESRNPSNEEAWKREESTAQKRAGMHTVETSKTLRQLPSTVWLAKAVSTRRTTY